MLLPIAQSPGLPSVFGPILFALLGFLFGCIARKGAWLAVLFPAFFGVLDIFAEGADIPSVTFIIISIILSAVGVLLGQLLVRPRWDTEKQRVTHRS